MVRVCDSPLNDHTLSDTIPSHDALVGRCADASVCVTYGSAVIAPLNGPGSALPNVQPQAGGAPRGEAPTGRRL